MTQICCATLQRKYHLILGFFTMDTVRVHELINVSVSGSVYSLSHRCSFYEVICKNEHVSLFQATCIIESNVFSATASLVLETQLSEEVERNKVKLITKPEYV